MIRAQFIALALLLCACTGRKTETVQAEQRKEATPPPSTTQVVMEETAQKQARITVQSAVAGSTAEALRATGRIGLNENRTWRVGALTDGRVVRVLANPGDAVNQGQVLAYMHGHDVHEGRAEYRGAREEVSRLTSAEAYARRFRDRATRLYELKAGSLEQLEHAESELRNTQAALARAKVELDRTRTHLEDFLGVAAEEPSDHPEGAHDPDVHDLIPVRAPASGILLERKVTAGTVVQTSSEMFVVTDLATLWMIAAVNEAGLPKLRTGMRATVRVQAHPDREFTGHVTRLGTELDPATRTIQARIELPNPSNLLKPEMYADAEIPVAGVRTLLAIPETAIQELKGHTAVFVQRGATLFEAQPVETGRSSGGRVEITSGLKPGDRVVVTGGFLLKSQLLKSSLAEEE
jgi:cobalt-zinc-cadmium efflux system membrane fusion protein